MKRLVPLFLALAATPAFAGDLPPGFVYLSDVAPTIVQDMRYAGPHNFVGRPIDGYEAGECILTEAAAAALVRVQAQLVDNSFSLIVWDCYRPARAVTDFKAWSTVPEDHAMKAEFYPNEDKAQFFERGYLASRSRHSRGSTVDLGIVPLRESKLPATPLPATPTSCLAPIGERYDDHTIDFGTGYDCLDPASAIDSDAVSAEARLNRQRLRDLMVSAGFKPYDKEWWHFELAQEPPGMDYFDFPITPR